MGILKNSLKSCGLFWGLLAGLCVPFGLSQKTYASLKLDLEHAYYLDAMKHDYRGALELYYKVQNADDAESKLIAQALYRSVMCHLELSQIEDAKRCFDRLQNEYSTEGDWLEKALKAVPSSFLIIEVPWSQEEWSSFEWSDQSGEVFGYSLSRLLKLEREERHLWRFETRIIADGYRSYTVEYDADTLNPLYSRYHYQPFDRWEIEHLVDAGALARAESGMVDFKGDMENEGLLMRQFPQRVGFSKNVELFRISEGSDALMKIQARSYESEKEGSEFLVFDWEVQSRGDSRQFFIRNDRSKTLIGFEEGEKSGSRVKLSRETLGDQAEWTDPRGFRLVCPDEWYPVFLPKISRGSEIWVILLPELTDRLWVLFEKTTNPKKLQDDFTEEADAKGRVLRVIERPFGDYVLRACLSCDQERAEVLESRVLSFINSIEKGASP